MRTERAEAPRFAIGELVAVIPPAVSRHVGAVGEVVSILLNSRLASLDKYAVRFDASEVEVFWDVQLERRVAA